MNRLLLLWVMVLVCSFLTVTIDIYGKDRDITSEHDAIKVFRQVPKNIGFVKMGEVTVIEGVMDAVSSRSNAVRLKVGREASMRA